MARKPAAAKQEPVTNLPGEGGGTQVLNEVAGVLALGAAAFALVSFLSLQPGDLAANWGGPLGYGLANVLVQAFGRAVYVIPVFLVALSVRLFRGGLDELSAVRVGAGATVLLGTAVFLGLLFPNEGVVRAGGWFGGFLGRVLRETCGPVGAFVVGAAALLLTLLFTTGITLRGVGASAYRAARNARNRWLSTPTPGRENNVVTLHVVPNRMKEERRDEGGPLIVLGADALAEPGKARRQVVQEVLPLPGRGEYTLPPTSLLDPPRHAGVRVDEEALRRSSEVLEAKLAHFGIEGKVVAVRPGPVINTFEIEPAPHVKVNRILALQDDLAMALRALSVRILAPVPGKAVVGIEVANSRRENVYLKEILESPAYVESASCLTLGLGKDSSGIPVVADLARMPHLLLAGATGTGKSVSLNAMIMSILGKAAPRDVRFVMIDLKMLELSLYENLPHQIVPVVTDPKKAVIVLKNLAEQMDERYRILKQKGVRSIDAYNALLAEERGKSDAPPIELRQVVSEGDAIPLAAETHHEHMPKIVIIIDELADLMMNAGRHAEEPITRLAQKARACGMHMILATQRPSVDVITGLIKANFPARISFQVTSRVDSRTILDSIGAERLLGGGDMLYMPPGTARVQRLHGAFVSEDEIHSVTAFVSRQAQPQYCMELLEGGEEEEGGGSGEEVYDDAMYDQAVRLVTETRQASISWVQRRLRVGYNRAARMIERMEREGVVSASENGRPREVLARRIDAEDA